MSTPRVELLISKKILHDCCLQTGDLTI